MPGVVVMSHADDDEKYESHKRKSSARQREIAAAGKEIGPIPPVADQVRRDRCRPHILDFCRTYFPGRFPWRFSSVHEEAGERIDRCSFNGGLFAQAMQRGGGKTTIAECSVIRDLVYGVRRFVALFQATEPLAAKSLKKIIRELETNDLLFADFPEVCFPIRKLDRIAQRSNGQTVEGRPTLMEWHADGITLPTVKGSAASGGLIHVAGLTGAFKGVSALGPGGVILRPDKVVIDDAQTRESARSPTQTAERESIITDDIMGLAGPGSRMAAFMPCTPIYPADLSERFLSHERHPEWQGLRSKMLTAFPANMDWWERYREVQRESQVNGGDGKEATELYAAERETADAGAAVSWPERMEPGELSGIQCAMNKFLVNPRGFKAEYQCEAEDHPGAANAKELVPAKVVKRLSGLPRFEVPREAQRLTAFIDLGGELHWYAVVAWDAAFGGAVVDYGAWPRQSRATFAADDARPGLSAVHAGIGETARVYAGLSGLTAEVLSRAYQREQGGGEIRVERCLIDAGWNSQTVYQFARQSPFAGIIYPSKGIGRTTTARGVSEWKPRPGERSGFHWRLTISETGRGQMVQFDPDAWKTRLYEMLTAPLGSKGCLTFWGKAAADGQFDPRAHELIAEHLSAETSEPITLRGATFDKWRIKPHRPDNHLLDALTGCAVAASVTGLTWSAASAAGMPELDRKPRAKVKMSELMKQREAERSKR